MRSLLLVVAAGVLFIEEFGWRPLTALVARLTRWPPFARLEARVSALPPRLALVLFLAPAVLLFPLKLAALWLIEDGQTMLGISIIVGAKVIGTAFVGRLFILVEPQLMQFAWFARGLAWWRATKVRVHAAWREARLWQGARAIGRAIRMRWRRLLRPGS